MRLRLSNKPQQFNFLKDYLALEKTILSSHSFQGQHNKLTTV